MKSLREKYAFEFRGDCMGELIPSGSMLHADPAEEIRPMDVVSVLLDSFTGPWAAFINAISGEGFCGLVKVFLGVYEANGEPVCLLGQLNPPTLAMIPHSAIAAIDKVVDGNCPAPELSATDKQAIALIAPFAGIGMARMEGQKQWA